MYPTPTLANHKLYPYILRAENRVAKTKWWKQQKVPQPPKTVWSDLMSVPFHASPPLTGSMHEQSPRVPAVPPAWTGATVPTTLTSWNETVQCSQGQEEPHKAKLFQEAPFRKKSIATLCTHCSQTNQPLWNEVSIAVQPEWLLDPELTPALQQGVCNK